MKKGTLEVPAAATRQRVLPAARLEAQRLAATIECAVHFQTNRGVRGLVVVVDREGVLLKGSCQTFYCKQLAQQAALGGMRGQGLLTNAIEVSPWVL